MRQRPWGNVERESAKTVTKCKERVGKDHDQMVIERDKAKTVTKCRERERHGKDYDQM